MKNLLRTALAVILMTVVASVFAQQAVEIRTTSQTITVDGEANEAIWADVTAYSLNKIVASAAYEAITDNGEDCAATWKALWDGANTLYILVEVTDDANQPGDGATQPWTFDKVEIYFDVNTNDLSDGVGASSAASGHYQLIAQANNLLAEDEEKANLGQNNAILVTGTDYVLEMAVDISKLKSKDDVALAVDAIFGFDVSVIDNDSGVAGERGRIIWANDGTGANCGDENWNCMDDAGVAKLVNLDVNAVTAISNINLDNSFKSYPNPVSSLLIFNKTVDVELYTLLGEKIMWKNNVNSVNVEKLKTGIYCIKAVDKEGKSFTRKIVKR